MKRCAVVAILLALMLFTIASVAQDSIFPYKYKRLDLDNGFRAYLIKAGAPGQVAYITMVRTGSRDEWEKGKSGFAHFFEHMMFRGTEKYPEYDAITTDMGADRNGFTSSDRTVYYVIASSEYLDRIADLESDRFQRLKYNEPDFRVEAGAVLGEYEQGKFSPNRFLNEAVRDLAFDKHTYKHTTIGFGDDVRAMPEGYEYSISFYNRYYRPENCVLLIVGDFDEAEAEAIVHKYYDGWETGYVPPEITPEPEQTAPRELVLQYPGRTKPVLAINYKSPAWSATDKLAVASEVLGSIAFGQNSEIYRKLVLQEQRLQYLNDGFNLSRDPYLLSITAMVLDPEDVKAIEQEVYATVEKFQNELCDEKVLEDTKSNMKYGFLMRMETAQGVGMSLMNTVVFTGGIEAIEDYYKTLDSITPEDLREAARTYLVENGRTVVTMVQAEGR